MPRTTKCRKIRSFPDYYSFVPEEADAEKIETVILSLDANGEANCDHHEHGEGHSCGHGKCHE